MKCIMLDNFIPPDVRVKLFSQVEFDENKDDWRVGSSGPTTPEEFCRMKANPKSRRPLSDLAMRKIRSTSQIKYRVIVFLEVICLFFNVRIFTKH